LFKSLSVSTHELVSKHQTFHYRQLNSKAKKAQRQQSEHSLSQNSLNIFIQPESVPTATLLYGHSKQAAFLHSNTHVFKVKINVNRVCTVLIFDSLII